MKEKAVIYTRFSSDMQREESIDAQIRACKYFAQRENIEIIKVYTDRAKTGTTVKGRAEFLQMIDDSKAKAFNLVLVHKLNRFGRDSLDTLHYKKELERSGVSLVSVTEKLDNSPEGKLMLMVIAGMNEFYSENLRVEVMKGLKENAYNGKHTGGIPPLGYNVDPETKMLVINPREAESVKMIFSMYLDGMTYGEIMDALNERDFRTKVGKQFGRNSLHEILKNPKYTGLLTYSRLAPKDMDGKRNSHAYKNDEDIIKIPGAVPQIVSQEDFNRVQMKMFTRKKPSGRHKAKRTYLLSGKVICGKCGGAYIGNCRVAHLGRAEYLTYRCNSRVRPRCKGWEIRLDTLESMVLGELANIVFDEAIIPRIIEAYSHYLMEQCEDGKLVVAAIKNQITAIQKEMDNIISVIAKTASEALVTKLNSLDNDKAALTEKLNKSEQQRNVKELQEQELLYSFRQAREMLKSGKLRTVKTLVKRYVQKVIINGDNIEVQFNLNVNNKVVPFPDASSEKETPQIARQTKSVMSSKRQHKMLVRRGGDGGN